MRKDTTICDICEETVADRKCVICKADICHRQSCCINLVYNIRAMNENQGDGDLISKNNELAHVCMNCKVGQGKFAFKSETYNDEELRTKIRKAIIEHIKDSAVMDKL